jgi:hypothetical protein
MSTLRFLLPAHKGDVHFRKCGDLGSCNAECCYTEGHNAKCRYAECLLRVFMLSVDRVSDIMLSVVRVSVIMVSVVRMSGILLDVIMVSVCCMLSLIFIMPCVILLLAFMSIARHLQQSTARPEQLGIDHRELKHRQTSLSWSELLGTTNTL